MFKELEKLRSDLGVILLSALTPHSTSDVAAIAEKWPSCPTDYLTFLIERGSGPLIHEGEHFLFVHNLLSAEKEYYGDRLIYDYGAKGDIMIFGWESSGTAYGFDSGDEWHLVEVDEFRIVTRLGLSFRQFVEGLLICYPQIPMRYESGVWFDGVGQPQRVRT